jgi:phosphorylcholine metabolism protein LicD
MVNTICIIITILINIGILYYLLYYNKYDSSGEKYLNPHTLSPRLSNKDIENLKLGQKKMTNILKVFDNICKKYNLKYWVIGGTFIGTIRHSGWIPWDGDMDIVMMEDDYSKLQNIIKQELPNNMVFIDRYADKSHICPWGKIRDLTGYYGTGGYNEDLNDGIMLDIFIGQKQNDNLNLIDYEGNDGKSKYDDVFPLKYLYFEDILVPVPNKYKKLSKQWYGSFPPKLLPISERFPHEGRIIPNNTSEHMIKKYDIKYDIDNNIISRKHITL